MRRTKGLSSDGRRRIIEQSPACGGWGMTTKSYHGWRHQNGPNRMFATVHECEVVDIRRIRPPRRPASYVLSHPPREIETTDRSRYSHVSILVRMRQNLQGRLKPVDLALTIAAVGVR